MRRNRTRRNSKSSGRLGNIIIFFVLAPVVAILITIGLFKHFILPYIGYDDNPSNVEVGTKIDENNSQKNTYVDKENPNDTDSLITLELEGLSFFNVQLGSFSSKDNAQTLVDQLKENGINGYLVENDGFKVFAGTFFSREEAEKYRDELKKTYNDAFIKKFNIGGISIEYLASDYELEDEVVELVSTISNSFIEEAGLWTKAVSNNNVSDLREKTIDNNSSIEAKLASIKGKVKSESLQDLISSLETQYLERYEMINSLIDNNPDSIVNSYKEFNSILVKYMKTITQGQ